MSSKKVLGLAVFLLVIGLPFMQQAEAANFTYICGQEGQWIASVNDTYGKSDDPTTAFSATGNAERVHTGVRSNPAVDITTHIQFNLTRCGIPTGMNVVDVKFGITEQDGVASPTTTLSLHQTLTGGMTNEYTENMNAFACGTDAIFNGNCNQTAEAQVTIGDTDAQYNMTITNLFRRIYVAGNKTLDFFINGSDTNEARLESKEGADTAAESPSLFVVLSDVEKVSLTGSAVNTTSIWLGYQNKISTNVTVTNLTSTAISSVLFNLNGTNITGTNIAPGVGNGGVWNFNATLVNFIHGNYTIRAYALLADGTSVTNSSQDLTVAMKAGMNITSFTNFFNGTAISPYNLYATNGTAARQHLGRTGESYFPVDQMPTGQINVTLFANGFQNVSLNFTLNDSYLNRTAFTSSRLQEFRAADNSTGAAISVFSVSLSNGTATMSGSASNGKIALPLVGIPFGSVNLTVTAPGYATNTSIISVTGASEINMTSFLAISSFTINGVFDENTLVPLCYNYTLTNQSSVYSGNGCGAISVNSSALPTGTNVRVNIQNASYQERDYYVTISQAGRISLTGYLLPSGGGVQITTFVYSNSQPSGIEGAMTSALRFINGSYVVVEQKTTDTQGKGYFYLNTFAQYQIVASYGSASKTISSYYPNSAFILYIQLPDNAQASNLTWVFDTVGIVYSPTNTFVSGVVPISYSVTDSANSIEYYGLDIDQIYANGTELGIYSTNVSGSPGGGNIVVNLNTTGTNATRWDVTIRFKRSTFDEWNTTYRYFPSSFPGLPDAYFPTNVIPGLITNVTAGDLGTTNPATLQWLAVLIALAAALAAVKVTPDFAVEGGGIVFTAVLALFAWAGWFEWGFVLLLGMLAALMIGARRLS